LKLFTLSAAGNPEKKRPWLSGLFGNLFNGFEFSEAGKPKDKALLEVLQKHSLNKRETLFIDDRFFNVKAGINAGIHTVRMQPKHHLPLPPELKNIKIVTSLSEFEKYVNTLNKE